MNLKFTDGITVDTSGSLRILKLPDGLYVVGNGYLIPVNSIDEANKIMKDFKTETKF